MPSRKFVGVGKNAPGFAQSAGLDKSNTVMVFLRRICGKLIQGCSCNKITTVRLLQIRNKFDLKCLIKGLTDSYIQIVPRNCLTCEKAYCNVLSFAVVTCEGEQTVLTTSRSHQVR